MGIPTRVGHVLGAIAIAALLAGCSGAGSSMQSVTSPIGHPQSVVVNHVPTVLPQLVLRGLHPSAPYMGKSWAKPNVSGTLVYLCGYYANACNWFPNGSNTVAGTLASLSNPQGLTSKGSTVIIANTGASNVLEYPKGSTTLSKTLSDTGYYPVDVAADSNGDIYVANIFDTSFNPGSVSYYASGATSPTSVITDPNFYQVISVSVNESHHLVTCYNNSSGIGACDEQTGPGGTQKTIVTGLGFVGGNEFDSSEHLAVDDQVGVVTNMYKGSTFTLCGSIPQTGDPLFLSFNHTTLLHPTTSDIYIANAINGNATESTYATCSSTSTLEFTYSSGWSASNPPFGVATDPGQGT